MFIYASLFVAAFITAAIILWLYRALVGVGKAVYQAMLPSYKTEAHDPTAHVEEERLALTVNDTPTPWGWAKHSTPSRVARTAKIAKSDPVPWGWPGSSKEIRDHEPLLQLATHALTEPTNHAETESKPDPDDNTESAVGWPYREDKFDFAGKAYKVIRKDAPEKTKLSSTGTPWGW